MIPFQGNKAVGVRQSEVGGAFGAFDLDAGRFEHRPRQVLELVGDVV